MGATTMPVSVAASVTHGHGSVGHGSTEQKARQSSQDGRSATFERFEAMMPSGT